MAHVPGALLHCVWKRLLVNHCRRLAGWLTTQPHGSALLESCLLRLREQHVASYQHYHLVRQMGISKSHLTVASASIIPHESFTWLHFLFQGAQGV